MVGRLERRKERWKEGRKEGRMVGRQERRKEGKEERRKGGRKEGRCRRSDLSNLGTKLRSCIRLLISISSMRASCLELGSAVSMDDDYSFKAAVAAAAGTSAAGTGTSDEVAGQATVRADVSPSSLFLQNTSSHHSPLLSCLPTTDISLIALRVDYHKRIYRDDGRRCHS